MKKSLIALAVLLVLAIAGIAAGFRYADSGKDRVTVTEQTVLGSPEAARGLTLETQYSYDYQIFWHTVCPVSAEPQPETDFRFCSIRQETYRESEDVLYLYAGNYSFGMSGSIDLEWEKENARIDGAMILPVLDVADRTAAGETRTETLSLRDYYDWFPICMDGTPMLDIQNEDEWAKKLNRLFPVPVPESLQVEVTVSRAENGAVYEVNCQDVCDTPVWLSAECVVLEDAVYLLPTGNVDFSHLPLGYGVYRIPRKASSQQVSESVLDLDRAENVFAVDPARSQAVRLLQGLDEGELLILEDSAGTLTVLDAGRGEVRQRLDLGQTTGATVWHHENLLILAFGLYEEEPKLQVWQRENGAYHLWLKTDMVPMNGDNAYMAPVFAFDGQRLAMAAGQLPYQGVSYRAVVYDQTGAIYAGDYTYSCDNLPEPPHTWEVETPLLARWEK